MPGFVGAVQIININTGAAFNIGDVFQIHPISYAKTFSGAGSFNTGEEIRVRNQNSATNSYDADGLDQGILLNL
ncbi:germination protein PA [Siminovitchia terrae]|uniref:Germination protein PA n=1 Tax=Siminovitchia terrae TaxID=1914933 RepID=A0A429X8T9_SIMTE|nr:spore germination protein [Siminovitchia terrae]RST59623.1 spore germination protein [Siminovitchia terrae]GIN89941.1 germination protein PA [Siminovitchia terrae]GIN97780.1 germination protein PA [Siminovitchia terrae]